MLDVVSYHLPLHCSYHIMIIQKQWRYTVSTLQIRIDDTLKKEADALFASLGLNTSTAVRIFWGASIENAGIPFCVQHKKMPHSLQEAIYDSRHRTNLNGPFDSAEEALASMLEE